MPGAFFQSAPAAAALNVLSSGATNAPSWFCISAYGHLVLLGVGVLDVADRAVEALHVGGDALVALAADAGRPFHRGAVADLLFPLGADLGQIVGEDERGARAVGAVHHRRWPGRAA